MRLLTLGPFLLFIGLAFSACAPRDYESIIGGYKSAHGANQMTFDVDEKTSDLLVAGRITQWETTKGFIYYIREDYCRIEWAFATEIFSLGVKKI